MSPVPGSSHALFALVLALLLASAPAAAKRIAVMPLAGEDTTGMVEALRTELTKRGEHEVLTQAQTQEKINGATDLGLSCKPADVGCLSKVGVLGDIALVLSVATATGPTGVDLVLILIDAEQGEEAGRVTRRFQGAPNTIALDALDELLDPDGYQGDLEVVVVQEGAEVRVDDEVWGTSPLGGPRTLKPGKHTVVVTVEGMPPSKRDVEVRKGETTSVEFNLTAAAAPEAAVDDAGGGGGGLGALATNPLVLTPTVVAAMALVLTVAGAFLGAGSYLAWAWNSTYEGQPAWARVGDGRDDWFFPTPLRRVGQVTMFVGPILSAVGVVGFVLAGGTAVGVGGALMLLEDAE